MLAQRRPSRSRQPGRAGVPEPSIKVVTIGQEGALCDDASTECRQLNRRVHLEIRKLPRAAALEPLRPQLMVGDTIDTQPVGGSSPDSWPARAWSLTVLILEATLARAQARRGTEGTRPWRTGPGRRRRGRPRDGHRDSQGSDGWLLCYRGGR